MNWRTGSIILGGESYSTLSTELMDWFRLDLDQNVLRIVLGGRGRKNSVDNGTHLALAMEPARGSRLVFPVGHLLGAGLPSGTGRTSKIGRILPADFRLDRVHPRAVLASFSAGVDVPLHYILLLAVLRGAVEQSFVCK